MTTKEQERQALTEIKAILSRLDPDGYINTALEGCMEIAENNIQNDFVCSMKQRWESAAERVKQLTWENEQISKCNDELRRDLEGTQKELSDVQEDRDKIRLNMAKSYREVDEMFQNTLEENDELKCKLNTRDAEIVHLKAKLYDFITAEKEV